MRRITWKNEAEQTCILTIQDERNDTVDMVPGGEPFMTSIQQTTEFFTPIRTASGYVRVEVDSVDDVADLVGSAPLRRAVELQVEGVVRWRGFLACESFTQSWDVMPSLELPVMSPLEASRGIQPSADIDKLGYISIAQFLCNLNSELGEPYDNFYFPTISEPSTTLKYLFTMQNYATATDKNTKHEVSYYYSILEDICKLFGWQCIEWETSLVFMAGDVKALETGGNNFRGYTSVRLAQLAAGTNDDPTELPAFTPTIPVIYGADHRMTYMAGKKSVESVGQLNERDEEIWSMDVVEQCVYKGSELLRIGFYVYSNKKYAAYQGEGQSSPNGNIVAYNNVGDFLQPDTNGYNIKYYNYYHPDANKYGGSAVNEEFYEINTYFEVTGGQKEYVKRLITKGYSTPLLACVAIRTNFWYDPTQNKEYDALSLDADIKRALNANDAFETVDGTIYVEVSILIVNGNTTYYYSPGNGWTTSPDTVILAVKNGKIQSYGKVNDSGGTSAIFYASITAPTNISGEVQLMLLATTETSYGQGNYYISWENLKINLVATNTRRPIRIEDKEQRENENTKKIELNNGFTDSWSQDCGLTLAREAVPDSYGVVLKNDKTLPTDLYSGKYPEDAMADRAAAYFFKARLKIEAIVSSEGKMLNPLIPYWFFDGGKQYICVEQQQNWKTNEVYAGFFEPTYEDE